MMLNSIVIRISAAAILITGILLFIAQSGGIGAIGTAQDPGPDQTEERLLGSSSRQSGLVAPEIVLQAGVRLPMASDPVTAHAPLVLAGFREPAAAALPLILPETATPLSPVAEVSPFGLPCTVEVFASALPAAMVALDVIAPCHPGAPLIITHAGMTIAAATDAMGLLTLDLPAFAQPAEFVVTLGDPGIIRVAQAAVPDLDAYDRIGLTWQGDAGLELHAMEFGASFGAEGHVWPGAPRAPQAAIDGRGGFLTRLTAGEHHAQIYTLPRAALAGTGSVRLSIDAPATAGSCAREASARILRSRGGTSPEVREVRFTHPSCDAVGEVLVLQNLPGDLRLAAN